MIVDRERVARALPGYVLGEQLGSGAFGLVLAGTHRQMGRPVAIKVMQAEGLDATTAGFAAEAQVLARLDHPHVVRVYDYVEDDDLCLVVMELLAGGTLTGRRAGISPEQACAVGLAVAAALDHAHRHGVLHRDIKPDNVLFASDGTLKVSDFGIAKLFEGSATTTNGVVGTPMYMAPEQIQPGRLGPKTDLYALGVILYALLTGRMPFDPKLPLLPLLSKHLTEPPPPMDGVAAPVAEVVLRALEKSPADRPPDAATFGLDLAHAAATVFGPGWTARGQLPLHLDDAVRAATDRPPTWAPWDFFVSYAGADQAWADWIVWELGAAGYQVLLQARDGAARSCWTAGMGDGVQRAARTLVLLSDAYLESVFEQTAWPAVRESEAKTLARTLVQMRVQDCVRPDLLGDVPTVDLFGYSVETARKALLDQATVALADRRAPSAVPAVRATLPLTLATTESATLVAPQLPPTVVAPPFPVTLVLPRPTPPNPPWPVTGSDPLVPKVRSSPMVKPPADDEPSGSEPPEAERVGGPSTVDGPVGPRVTRRGRGPRQLVAGVAWACGIAVVVLVVAAGVLAPAVLSGGGHPAAKASVSPKATLAVTTSGTPRASVAALAPASVRVPTVPSPVSSSASVPSHFVTPRAALATTRPAANPAPAAPVGPGTDAHYLAGSEVTVPGCAGWLDFSGNLNGMLSAGAAACEADLSGTAPGKSYSISIAAANNTEKNSSGWYFYFGDYTVTAQICIWNQSDTANRRCSPTFTDHSGTVTRS
ncbi:MAG: protein kinase domain-containing protein [Frankia sp.]